MVCRIVSCCEQGEEGRCCRRAPPSARSRAPSSLPLVDVCIIGSGISGSSTAFFLTNYTSDLTGAQLRVFERCHKVGGRLATAAATAPATPPASRAALVATGTADSCVDPPAGPAARK